MPDHSHNSPRSPSSGVLPLRRCADSVFAAALAGADREELTFLLVANGNSPHWAAHHRLIDEHVVWFINQGSIVGQVGMEQVPVTIEEGDLHWIAPRVGHSLEKMEGSPRLRNFAIRFRLVRDGALLVPEWDRRQVRRAHTARELMGAVIDTMSAQRALAFEKARALLVALFIEVANAGASPAPTGAGETFTPDDLAFLRALVEKPGNRAVTVAELATAMMLSDDYFSRKFRRTMGMAPQRWLMRHRMERGAFLLLETRMTIQQIANVLGLHDPRLFTRQFKAAYGVTPKFYRRRG